MQEAIQAASGRHQPIPRELGNGLLLRRAVPRDIEPLIAFFSDIFDPQAGVEVRALINGGWPVGSLDTFPLSKRRRPARPLRAFCAHSQPGRFYAAHCGSVGAAAGPVHSGKLYRRMQAQLLPRWAAADLRTGASESHRTLAARTMGGRRGFS